MANLAHALDLEHMLTNISLGVDRSMDWYFHSIKNIVDVIAAIQSLIYDLELIQVTIVRLRKDYVLLSLPFPCNLCPYCLMFCSQNCFFKSNG